MSPDRSVIVVARLASEGQYQFLSSLLNARHLLYIATVKPLLSYESLCRRLRKFKLPQELITSDEQANLYISGDSRWLELSKFSISRSKTAFPFLFSIYSQSLEHSPESRYTTFIVFHSQSLQSRV